jgi:hypothetical protein
MIAGMGLREAAEALRILSQYKRLVLLGKVRLPLAAARRLVGPDCAYHLYGRTAPSRRRSRRR